MTERSLREQRRERRRALSKDQILDAAERVFARKGFHEAALREIAELAEFSVGAVYGFFPGKDDIYREIFLRRAAEFLPGMRGVLSTDAPPRRQLLDLADWQVGFFRRFPEFGRLVLRGGSIAPPLSEPHGDSQILHNFQTAQQMQADLFERGRRAGELRAGDPPLLSRMFSGLVSAFQAVELSADAPAGDLARLHEVIEAAFVVAGE
ncbi:TetR/AcrR family transcriptional regulator [Actinomadura sp. DC4]|uniref:TetR/AcrR family transcriptional regulator n=1 Tax=Actinomadura sp. DC4 TaxID=3055069 RepID=UPI0025AF0762|nr:TetR/AcrR family transcriptional regulator [Actinomadura sp. DC4]MDN3357597.1 TetR/AcrR family transcriptional regulator [Actinomadura sp. DC4]